MNNREIFTKSQIDPNKVWFVPNNIEVSMYIPNDSNSIYVKKVWVDSDNKETNNHPSSIELNLIQNILTPTGVTVNTHIYVQYDWEENERVIDNQSLVVREGGSIKMTLPIKCKPGEEVNNVVVEGATDYSFSNEDKDWGRVVLTINNVTPNMNLNIKLANDYSTVEQVEYDYDREYNTDNRVIDTVTLNESNNWSYTWNDLPKQVDDHDCVYTLEEDVPSGYQVLYTNNDGILAGNITVTNKKLDNTELPDTGGFGTFGYYAIGALFITATLFAIIAINKKKEAYEK